VYSIYRDGVLLQETRTTSLADASVREQTTYRYHLTVRNGDFGPESDASAICVVHTPADLAPPELVAAVPSGDLMHLIVRFSEPVSPENAANPAHFQITPAATVTAAALGPHSDTVRLAVDGLAREQAYQLQVRDLTDTAAAGNVVTPGATCAFETDFLIAHCTATQAETGGLWRLHGEAAWTSDRSALLLNGRDAYAEGPAELNLGSVDFTLAAWIRKNKPGSAIVAAKGNGFGSADEWSWGWEDPPKSDTIAFRSGNHYYTTAPGSILPDTWIHIAFVKMGTAGVSYVNGRPSGEPHDLSSLGDLTNARPLFVGRRRHEPTPAWFDGQIAGLRVYTRALVAQEVKDLASARSAGANPHPGERPPQVAP